jgi:hypothetical protein
MFRHAFLNPELHKILQRITTRGPKIKRAKLNFINKPRPEAIAKKQEYFLLVKLSLFRSRKTLSTTIEVKGRSSIYVLIWLNTKGYIDTRNADKRPVFLSKRTLPTP